MKPLFTIVLFFATLLCQSQSVNLDWAKKWGGTNNSGVKAMELDRQGNIYVAGWFSGQCYLDPTASIYNFSDKGMGDIFISKFNSTGNLIWGKTQGGKSNDYVNDITLDATGNILTAGYFLDTADFDPGSATYTLATVNNIYNKSYVSKLDPMGNFIWAKSFGNSNGYGAYSVITDQEKNIFVTGTFEGTADFDPSSNVFNMTANGNENAYILKLDSNGIFMWAKQIGNYLYNHGLAIDIDITGNVYITGEFSSVADLDPGSTVHNFTSKGQLDIFILKLDTDGNYVWAKTIGGNDVDDPTDIVVSKHGNIYLSGMYTSNNTDFDPGTGVYNLPFNGWNDIFFMKLDANGNFKWCNGIGGQEYDSPSSITLDNTENVYVSGRFRMQADFNSGSGNDTLASLGSGSDEAFMMRTDSNGIFQWAAQLVGNMDYANGIRVNSAHDVYVAGNFSSQTDFDPSLSTFNMFPSGVMGSAFLMKLNQASDVSVINLNNDNKSITCFPIPFQSELNIYFNDVKERVTIELINVTGEILAKEIIEKKSSTKLNTVNLAAGVYFLKTTDNDHVLLKKIMKD